MSVSTDVDSRSLSHAVSTIRRLADRFASKELKETIKADIVKLNDRTFANEQDPYGKKWHERKHEYDHKILNPIPSLMRQSFKFQVTDKAIKVSNTRPHATFIQKGLGTLQWARNIVPTEQRGLPKEWTAVIKRRFLEAFRKVTNE